MSDFDTQRDQQEAPRQRRARRPRQGLPLWPLVVLVLLIAVVFISLWNPFAPSTEPIVEEIIPTATSALPTPVTLPTATRTPRPTSTPTPSLPPEIGVGVYVKVVNTEADGLRFRYGPGMNTATKKLIEDGVILKVLDGPEEADGLTWWRLEDPAEEDEDLKIGWAADEWLEPTLP
jgi:hypothetical protein